MKQLEFTWGKSDKGPSAPFRAPASLVERDPAALREDLEQRTGLRIHLTITDNTSTLMTVRFDRAGAHARLRLHRMFLRATGKVLDALATWVKNPRRRTRDGVLERFMRDNRRYIRPRVTLETTLDTQGVFYDLQDLFDELNHQYFGGKVSAKISWGRMPGAPRRRHSIRFGSYAAEENLIRIHPLLDQEFVPRYFVKYIVFHEMLHADVGIKTSPSGRRSMHTPEFKRREQAYPDYARSVAWQDKPAHLRKLLR